MIAWVKSLSIDEKAWLALGVLAWFVAGILAVLMTATGRW